MGPAESQTLKGGKMTKKHPHRGVVARLGSFFSEFERARYSMPFPWRGTFLIVAVAPALHAPLLYTLLVFLGYQICAVLEQMKKEEQKDRAMDDEISWETDPDDPEWEDLEGFSRVKLSKEHQIMVVRVAELFGRMA